MLIPSIDLMDGKVVQLVQGERLALEDRDVLGWVRRFERFPIVQLIDLDAAKGHGSNQDLVAQICGARPCRVGGGIRSVARARDLRKIGARQVIVGSALFSQGRPDLTFARDLAEAIGSDQVIAAVDSRGGRVVIHGWKTVLPLTASEAVRALEPFCDGFLYTHVDTEGLMRGIDFEAVRDVREATIKSVTAAGGITTREEIDALERMGVDAVVGMAIYTGFLPIDPDQS